MAKDKVEVQKEIYEFVEERILEGAKGVILQQILDKFCDKYKISEPTVTRYLEEMTAKKSLFRLRTWYDKNRYYSIPTVSIRFQMYVISTIILPFVSFIIDRLNSLPINIFYLSLFFFFGFWLSFILERKKNKNSDK